MMGYDMAEKSYTKLTLESKLPTEQWPEIFSIETNTCEVPADVFITNLVAPLMVATGYRQADINDAIGRVEDE